MRPGSSIRKIVMRDWATIPFRFSMLAELLRAEAHKSVKRSAVIADGNYRTSWPGRKARTHLSLGAGCEECILAIATRATSAAHMFSPAELFRYLMPTITPLHPNHQFVY